MKPHHFKTDAEWLADVRRTAKAVQRQNKVLPSKPVELTAEEVLELVRRAEAYAESEAPIIQREGCPSSETQPGDAK